MARSGSSPGCYVHLVIMLTYFSRSILLLSSGFRKQFLPIIGLWLTLLWGEFIYWNINSQWDCSWRLSSGGWYLCAGNGSLVTGDGKDLICSLSAVHAHVRAQWEGTACKPDRPLPALEPAGTLFLNFPGSIITRIECLFKTQTKPNQELRLWPCVIRVYNRYYTVKFFQSVWSLKTEGGGITGTTVK